MLSQPTRVWILLIYRKHFAMMSPFFAVIGLSYFKYTLEYRNIRSNGWPIMKSSENKVCNAVDLCQCRVIHQTHSLLHALERSGNQANQTVSTWWPRLLFILGFSSCRSMRKAWYIISQDHGQEILSVVILFMSSCFDKWPIFQANTSKFRPACNSNRSL